MQIRHILTGQEITKHELHEIFSSASMLKKDRHKQRNEPLKGKTLAMIFDKPSLRTRFSFAVAMRELGGDIIESSTSTRKEELPEDQARVLSGYCQAMMVRTFADQYLQRMKNASAIPIINGLSDLHHPCQIFADLFTLQEVYGSLKQLTLTYIGDGNNILHSLLLLAPALGINIHYACPPHRMPNKTILLDAELLSKSAAQQNQSYVGHIKAFSSPEDAMCCADAVYTDVWNSMGFEHLAQDEMFKGFQVNEALMALAHPHAVFMHCLPMNRGQEVSMTLPDQPCSVIFQQSENRLHVQKALLIFLLAREKLG